MRLTWLGWAGVELEHAGKTIVIDPLEDAGAVFAAFGSRAKGIPLPAVTSARPGMAVAGLLTHLHRDHADAGALRASLAPGSPVLEPHPIGGGELENLATAQADHELSTSGLERRRMSPWETTAIARSRSRRCRRSTESATRKSRGSSPPEALASCTSATR